MAFLPTNCPCCGGSTFNPGPGDIGSGGSCGAVLCAALPAKWKVNFSGFSGGCDCFNVGYVEFTLRHYVCPCIDVANFIWEATTIPCSGIVLDNIWSILWSGSTNPLATTNSVKLWPSRFDFSGCTSDSMYQKSATVSDCLGPLTLNRSSSLIDCGPFGQPSTLTLELA